MKVLVALATLLAAVSAQTVDHCYRVHTGGKYDYRWRSMVPLGESKSVTFSVKASSSASIAFFNKTSEDGKGVYEINMQAMSSNEMSSIKKDGETKLEQSLDVLDGDKTVELWADCKNGLMRLGRGNVVGEHQLMAQDLQFVNESATYVSVTTADAAPGDWEVCIPTKDSGLSISQAGLLMYTKEFTKFVFEVKWIELDMPYFYFSFIILGIGSGVSLIVFIVEQLFSKYLLPLI